MAGRLPTEPPPRGMRDVLPARKSRCATGPWPPSSTVYRRHGFVRIETPAVESLASCSGARAARTRS